MPIDLIDQKNKNSERFLQREKENWLTVPEDVFTKILQGKKRFVYVMHTEPLKEGDSINILLTKSTYYLRMKVTEAKKIHSSDSGICYSIAPRKEELRDLPIYNK